MRIWKESAVAYSRFCPGRDSNRRHVSWLCVVVPASLNRISDHRGLTHEAFSSLKVNVTHDVSGNGITLISYRPIQVFKLSRIRSESFPLISKFPCSVVDHPPRQIQSPQLTDRGYNNGLDGAMVQWRLGRESRRNSELNAKSGSACLST
jgi:hypothetical protein